MLDTHRLAVLWSGGYSVEAFGRGFSGRRITSATMLVALLAEPALLLGGRESQRSAVWPRGATGCSAA